MLFVLVELLRGERSDRVRPQQSAIHFSMPPCQMLRADPAGIPHLGPWRRLRIELRGRFCRDIKLGRGDSLGKRIFAVVF
jgi:hypothetical protein